MFKKIVTYIGVGLGAIGFAYFLADIAHLIH